MFVMIRDSWGKNAKRTGTVSVNMDGVSAVEKRGSEVIVFSAQGMHWVVSYPTREAAEMAYMLLHAACGRRTGTFTMPSPSEAERLAGEYGDGIRSGALDYGGLLELLQGGIPAAGKPEGGAAQGKGPQGENNGQG